MACSIAHGVYDAIGSGDAISNRFQLVEITTQSLHGKFFHVDFIACALAHASKNRQRRAPALQGVLQEENTDEAWNKEKPLIDESP